MPVTDRHVRHLASWIEDDLDNLVDLVDERLQADVPEYFEGATPAELHANRVAIQANLEAVAVALEGGREMPEEAPPGAIDDAVSAARNGIPFTALDRTYRVGHAYIWELALQEILSWEMPEAERATLLQQASRFLFEYVNAVSDAVGRVYESERQRLLGRRERRREALVRDALAGVPIDSLELGYDLGGRHLAVVAWGEGRESAVTRIAELVRSPQSVVVGGPRETVWAWLAIRQEEVDVGRLLEGFEAEEGTGVGASGVHAGIEGFNRSHAEAQKAYELGSRFLRGRPLVPYREVALEALLLRDETSARTFAQGVLGELAGEDERSCRQRQTLRAYFGTGNNGASAAAILGVHERTVGYRLASIEQRLGASLTERRDEIAVALRILAVLQGED